MLPRQAYTLTSNSAYRTYTLSGFDIHNVKGERRATRQQESQTTCKCIDYKA